MTKTRTFANVWDAIEDSPEEAAMMTMRSQPRLNDLLHGKIDKFCLDTLITLARRAGLKVKIDVRPAA